MTIRETSCLVAYGVLYLGLSLPSVCVQADLLHYDFKGVDALFDPQFEYLSPLHGYTLLNTGQMANRRFYGNYGPLRKGIGCLEDASAIHAILVKNQDCPQDFTSELVQKLFPSQDGTNFVANQIPSDPIATLNSEKIGKLLGRISSLGEFNHADKREELKLKMELMDILLEGFNRKQFIKSRLQKINQEIANCGDHDQAILLKREAQAFSELNSEVGRIANQISRSEQELEKSNKWNQKTAEAFASLLISALKENRTANSLYPKHFSEQVLLAFFLKKGEKKQDVLKFVKGIAQVNPTVLRNQDVLIPRSIAHRTFFDSKYQKSDFNLTALKGAAEDTVHHLIKDPELLAFSMMEDGFRGRPFPPHISYASAVHSSLGGEAYPDCGETSLRNFLNLILYQQEKDGGVFDIKKLEELQKQHPSLSFHPRLREYYLKHSAPALSRSKEARDDWSENVASKHFGVEYLKPKASPQCEMNAGIDNMIGVLEHLLFFEKSENPLQKTKTRKEKLDALFDNLSRDGFRISWKEKENNGKAGVLPNKETAIEISINGSPKFIWEFMSGHFAFREIGHSEEDWKTELGNKVAEALGSKKGALLDKRAFLIPWVLSEENWDYVTATMPRELRSENFHDSLYYALPLASVETKIFVFKDLLKEDISHAPSHASKDILLRKVLAGIPTDDPHTALDLMINVVASRNQENKTLKELMEKFLTEPLAGKILKEAMSEMDIEAVQFLAEKVPDIFQIEDARMQTPLHWAAREEVTDVMEMLVKKFPGMLTKQDKDGKTPLYLAVEGRKTEIAEFLAKAAPETLLLGDLRGVTPVLLAGRMGFWKSVKKFLRAAPETAGLADKGGQTLMLHAASRAQLDVVDLLLKMAPQTMVNSQDNNMNPFFIAARFGHWSVIEKFVEKDPGVIKYLTDSQKAEFLRSNPMR